MNNLVIVGAGGHGAVVADTALCAGFNVLGFADSTPGRTEYIGFSIVASSNAEAVAYAREHSALIVIAIGAAGVRERVSTQIRQAGGQFATVVHPRACVSRFSSLGEGTVVFAGAVVQPRTTTGDHCILNTRCSVDHDSQLGDFVHLSPGVSMGGTVRIGRGTHLGVGVSVRNNVTIGSGSVIGVGAAVVSDLPDGVVAYGVPARVV